MTIIELNIPHLNREGFEKICQANRDLKLERNASGEVIIMPPTTPWTGKQNGEIYGQLWLWNRQARLGVGFDSSTGFTLPNGAVRSPDVSWVSNERWEGLNLA
ncbi:Uma2 family endonuclease, partial [Phormidium sp. CCY1219]|uniref:Uma2 family endonuclease n=1 Tax=Phormidium sp. CCY1219 TaxID=2886104 RepID=UPI002D1E8B99